jgi:tetratricopeptide (TPR) repeat protein
MRHITCFVFVAIVFINGIKAQPKSGSISGLTENKVQESLQVELLLDSAQKLYNVDLKKSLVVAQDALSSSEESGYDKGIQNALAIMSRIQRRLGNFSVAIEYNLRELSIAEKREDKPGMIDSYTTLGNIYSSLENYKEAKKNLAMANVLAVEVQSPNLSSIMNFIGRNFGKMAVYDSAEYWIVNALEYERKLPQKGYTISYIYNNLAEVYYFQKKYNSALKNYLLSKNLPEDKQSPFGKTFTLNGLALTYKELEQYDEAIRAAQQSIAISKKFSYRDKTKESYGILYEIYEEKHDFHDALLNYTLFNLYQDSIFNEDNLEYIENLKIQYEIEHVKTENELLRKDAELKDSNLAQQRKLTFLGSIALLSLIGAILFLYYGSRQKKKRNHFLAEFNKNLQEQVEERTKELVKSNLELIRQNNQLQQYGYITAHNLRAPVARILGLTNILKSDQLNPDEDLLIVDKLRRTTLELDTIINDMNAIIDIKNGVENS